jgi:hypothetical protein
MGRVVEDRQRDTRTGVFSTGLRRDAQSLSVIENRSLSGNAGIGLCQSESRSDGAGCYGRFLRQASAGFLAARHPGPLRL